MTWMLAAGTTWLVVAVLAALLVGRGVRLADGRDEAFMTAQAATPNFVVDVDVPGGFPPAAWLKVERHLPHQGLA